METLNAVLTFVLRPVVAWCLLAMILGQIAKTQIWTKERAYRKGRWQPIWWWGRKTLALHPFVAGVLIGLAWPGPIEDGYEGGTLLGILYFGVGGMASVWGFEAIKGLARRKGVEIPELPGLDDRSSRAPAAVPVLVPKPKRPARDDEDDDDEGEA